MVTYSYYNNNDHHNHNNDNKYIYIYQYIYIYNYIYTQYIYIYYTYDAQDSLINMALKKFFWPPAQTRDFDPGFRCGAWKPRCQEDGAPLEIHGDSMVI